MSVVKDQFDRSEDPYATNDFYDPWDTNKEQNTLQCLRYTLVTNSSKHVSDAIAAMLRLMVLVQYKITNAVSCVSIIT